MSSEGTIEILITDTVQYLTNIPNKSSHDMSHDTYIFPLRSLVFDNFINWFS